MKTTLLLGVAFLASLLAPAARAQETPAQPETPAETARLADVPERTETMRLSCQIQVREDLEVRVIRRLVDNPKMSDAGPTPIEWPADHPLPPED